jgi:hypothetical protein
MIAQKLNGMREFFGNRREQRDVFGMINHIKEELCIWGMAYAKGSAPASRE